MAHTAHPKGFRLQRTEDWDSRWIRKDHYARTLREDYLIRQHLQENLKDHGVERVEIERYTGKINIIIHTSRPGLIIGRGGAGVEGLRKAIRKIVDKGRAKNTDEKAPEIRLEVQEIKNPWTSAALTAQWVAQQLERRVSHRRALKQGLSKVMANKEIQGARIAVAGRLGGAEMSRREEVREGQLPLQTIRANIDYALREAQTTYGTIGVKVWMYKGETFE